MPKEEILPRADFSLGIVADTARHLLPPGAMVDAIDVLVDEPGIARKRGGGAFQSGELSGQSSIIGVAAPEYPGDPRVLAFASDTSNTTLYDVTTDTPSTPGPDQDCDSALLLENPPLLVDRLIVCDGRGTNSPKKVFIDTMVAKVADLAGAPPKAKYSCVHLGRLVLANGTVDGDNAAHPNRVWFGPLPDPEPTAYTISSDTGTTIIVSGDVTKVFFDTITLRLSGSTAGADDGYYTVVGDSTFDGSDTTITVFPALPTGTGDGQIMVGFDVFESYFDVDGPVTALASVAGVLIVWDRGGYSRVLGSTPPGYGVATSDVDMEVQRVDGSAGCIDARSVVHAAGGVVFANEQGVWLTNGAAPISLTTKAKGLGIRRLWTAAMAGFAPALGAVCCAGVLEQWLFVTIRHPDETELGRYQFRCYLPNRSWVRDADGITADMYATRFAPNSEIYAACGDTEDPPRLLRLSPIFTPTGDNMADANGEDVIPAIDLPYGDAGDLKSFGKGRVTHLLEVPDE